MRGGRSKRKGMGLRGTDTGLRPPPLHFLFHFPSSFLLMLPLLPPLVSFFFFIEVYTYMHTPRIEPILLLIQKANRNIFIIMIKSYWYLINNTLPLPFPEALRLIFILFFYLPSREPLLYKNAFAETSSS